MHADTNHSFDSVRKNPNFLDWNSQPRNHKLYPHFFRRYKTEAFEHFSLCGGITLKKQYGPQLVYLRTVPSAGALYPSEVYVQFRGQPGWVDGIYHYEPLHDNLTLLHEIESDGLEAYLPGEEKQGICFFISSAYFRSSWKYKNRAIRYIYLDAGHQIGTIGAMLNLKGEAWTIRFDLDLEAANRDFGFEGDEVMLAAVTAQPKEARRAVQPLREKLPTVMATDYLERNPSIEAAYAEYVQEHRKAYGSGGFGVYANETILARRSLRQFSEREDGREIFDWLMGLGDEAKAMGISLHCSVKNIAGVTSGLYQNGVLTSEGDFSRKCAYLCLEQSLVAPANVTLFFTADEVEYGQRYMMAGLLGHRVYLEAEKLGLGCSGIGAYYDDETRAFLKTEESVLYAMIVG